MPRKYVLRPVDVRLQVLKAKAERLVKQVEVKRLLAEKIVNKVARLEAKLASQAPTNA